MAEYQDFDLEIRRTGERYTARVLRSPAGEAEEFFVLPFSQLELENFILRLGFRRASVRGWNELATLTRQWGTKLFNALMVGQVASRFEASRSLVRERNIGLRIRMRLTSVPELINVPWEYLYDPLDRDFIACSKYTPIVRYLESPQAGQPLAVRGPLSVLIVVATPPSLSTLDVDREISLLKRAMSGLVESGRLRLEFIEHATYPRLQKRLSRTGDHVHILHFIGHGHYNEADDAGALVFESDTDGSMEVRAPELARVIIDHRSLRLVILNACEGGRTATHDPFAGVAQTLLVRGLPAVVAMQFEVSDEAACRIAERLYECLADGLEIDSAMGEVRIALLGSGNAVEWATPVLYMRAPEGRVFSIERGMTLPVAPLPPPRPVPDRPENSRAITSNWLWKSWGGRALLTTVLSALLALTYLVFFRPVWNSIVVVGNQFSNEVMFKFDGRTQTLQSRDEWSANASQEGNSFELYSCGWETSRTTSGLPSGCRWIPYTVFAGEKWDVVEIQPAPRIVLKQRRR